MIPQYPTLPIRLAVARARQAGHTVGGRWARTGLSFENVCAHCKAHGLITPAWYPWEQHEVRGPLFWRECR